MKFWKWLPGRQKNCSYMKMALWSFRIWKFGFDCYLLKYEDGAYLKLHTDPVNGKHWRTNVTLSGDSSFFVENKGFVNRKIITFRPDLYKHSLFVYRKTVKLSIGFALLRLN